MSNPNIVLIAAVYADTLGIGYKGKLPWTLHKEDLREFKKITLGSPIIMGRVTWESIGCKPLPGRTNIVIAGSGLKDYIPEGVSLVCNPKAALEEARKAATENIFIIGGESVYKAFLPIADELIISRIPKLTSDPDGILPLDSYFPDWTSKREFGKVMRVKKPRPLEGFSGCLEIHYYERITKD